MKPSPDLGTPCSGQSVNWNCLIVRDCPSYKIIKSGLKLNCCSWTSKICVSLINIADYVLCLWLSHTSSQCIYFSWVIPYLTIKSYDINTVSRASLGIKPTLASVTLNSLSIYWGMLYSAIGSTTKYWYLADLSLGQYWWHFSYKRQNT